MSFDDIIFTESFPVTEDSVTFDPLKVKDEVN